MLATQGFDYSRCGISKGKSQAKMKTWLDKHTLKQSFTLVTRLWCCCRCLNLQAVIGRTQIGTGLVAKMKPRQEHNAAQHSPWGTGWKPIRIGLTD